MSPRTSTEILREKQAEAMQERVLQSNVGKCAEQFGCLHYHTHDSRRSNPGMPDSVIITPGEHALLIIAELKKQKAKETDNQLEWLAGFRRVREIKVVTWRPMDWLDDSIINTIKGAI